MAEQHVRAVQMYSKIEDRLTRNILEIIALDIGYDDSPAITSNRKIKDRARTSINTARDCIEAIINSGELIAVRDGKYMTYTLNSDLIPYQRISGKPRAKTIENQVATIQDVQAIVSDLSTRIDTMSDTIIDTISETLYQKIVSIVSVPSTNCDTEVKRKNNKNNSGHRPLDADIASISRLYESEFGALTKISSNLIHDTVTEYGSEVVTEAIMEAVKANVRKWSYVEGILKNWATNGRGYKPKNGNTGGSTWTPA